MGICKCIHAHLFVIHVRDHMACNRRRGERMKNSRLNRWLHPTVLHSLRLRMLQAWIVIFTIVVILLYRDNRHQIQALKEQRATAAQLQSTNCGLRKFLITAEKARISSGLSEEGVRRAKDLAAAQGYYKLAQFFTNGRCAGKAPVPPKA